MTEWLSYSLSDFLLFSPRTYWRLLTAGNDYLWPLQLATVAIGAGLAMSIRQTRPWFRSAAFLVLGLLWCFIAWQFFWVAYAPINWIAPYVAVAFLIQAAAFVLYGVLSPGERKGQLAAAGVPATGLVAYGLFLHPWTPLLWDRPLVSADVFGTAPDATAIVTLGLILMQSRSAGRTMLLVIPLTWLTISSLTHLAFPDPQGWLLVFLTVAAATTALFGRFAGTVRA